MAKVSVDLEQSEHVALLSALGLAIASANRLSNRVGVTPAIKLVYQEEARKADALRTKVAGWVIK